MSGIGNEIQALDYNDLRTAIAEVLGQGEGPFGYGQPIQSQAVSGGNTVTIAADQWQQLRLDLANIRIHQTGLELDQLGISEVMPGDTIRYRNDSPNFQYFNILQTAINNKFSVAPSRTVLTSRVTETFSQAWSEKALADLTVTFNTPDEARYFFNSGGKIVFTSARTGGALTAQNSSWTSLLSSVGNFSFGADTPAFVNFYSLTDQPQVVFQQGPGAIYANNFYIIRARSNVTDNSNGGATEIIFNIEWVDGYVDPGPPAPGDLVDGVLSLAVSEIRAAGPLLSIIPGGQFTITPPSYSLSPIAAN